MTTFSSLSIKSPSSNLSRLILALETQSIDSLGFNMHEVVAKGYEDRSERDWSCGTVACLAGWTYGLMINATSAKEVFERYMTRTIEDARFISFRDMAEWLELPHHTAIRLFTPSEARISSSNWDRIPLSKALAVLRELRDSGGTNLDWRLGGELLEQDNEDAEDGDE